MDMTELRSVCRCSRASRDRQSRNRAGNAAHSARMISGGIPLFEQIEKGPELSARIPPAPMGEQGPPACTAAFGIPAVSGARGSLLLTTGWDYAPVGCQTEVILKGIEMHPTGPSDTLFGTSGRHQSV